MEDVFAVVLAAGAGRRMGMVKALAPLGDRTFLEAVLQTISAAKVTKTAVVLAKAEAEIRRRVDLRDARILRNSTPEQGPIASIRAALEDPLIAAAPAILVHPVDHPRVSADTLRSLLRHFHETGAAVVVPVHAGRRGHPTVFGAAVFEELRAVPPGEGARVVVRRDPGRVAEVEVDDPGVLMNLDRPEDLDSRGGR